GLALGGGGVALGDFHREARRGGERQAPGLFVDDEVVEAQREGLHVLLVGRALEVVADAEGAGGGGVVPREGRAAPWDAGRQALGLLLFLGLAFVGRALVLPLLVRRELILRDLRAALRPALRLGGFVGVLERFVGALLRLV